MLGFLHQHPKRASASRATLRWVICGAAPVPVSLIEAFQVMGIEIRQVYGATETHAGMIRPRSFHLLRR
jgi:fatty-acyl-CoA synthase